MKRFARLLWLGLCALAISGFSFLPSSVMAAPQVHNPYTLIDGHKITDTALHQKIVGTAVLKQLDSEGKPVLYGFTTLKGFYQYLQQNRDAAPRSNDPDLADFYWDINKGGSERNLRVGYRISYVGDTWNDQISSVVPACRGKWTILYQHRDFGGEGIAFENNNNTCSRYYNLTDYRLSGGQSWNDQASSLRVTR